jgi:hypothetical protein
MRTVFFLLANLTLLAAPAGAESLKAMYDRALSAHGYDRYIELEPGVVYTGGLWIGATFNRMTAAFEGVGEDVRIVGNGAILDLQRGELCIAYCNNRLDLSDCVVLDGCVKFRGYTDSTVTLKPQGSVSWTTFYRPADYAVRMHGCGAGIRVERNLVMDAVDTGPDFMYLNGEANDWLPTGTSFSLDLTSPSWEVIDNFTFHTDIATNRKPRRHFHILCPYG